MINQISNFINKLKKAIKKLMKKDISTIGKSVDVKALFAIGFFNYMCFPNSEDNSENIHIKIELLAFNLLSQLELNDNIPQPQHVEYVRNEINSQFTKRTSLQSRFKSKSKSDGQNRFGAVLSHLILHSEYVRRAAFPYQTKEKINNLFKNPYSEVIVKKFGIDPNRAIELLEAISICECKNIDHLLEMCVKAKNEFLDRWKNGEFPSIKNEIDAQIYGAYECIYHNILNVLPVTKDKLEITVPPTLEEWSGMLSLLSIGTDANPVPKDFVEVQRYPMYSLGKYGVLINDFNNALDQLFYLCEAQVHSEQSIYQKYQKNRAKWAQTKVFEYLNRIFPTENLYREVDYKAEHDSSSYELDFMIYIEPYVMLIEVKSSQFRFESQLGDLRKLKDDLVRNLKDAFDQAKRASERIISDSVTFKERSSGRIISIDKNNVDKVFLCTVSLNYLAGVATRLIDFAPLNWFKDKEYPWAISIPDLDVITRILTNEDFFFHYIERRLVTQQQRTIFLADELDFLGMYTQTRLVSSWIEQPQVDVMHISGDFAKELMDEKVTVSLPDNFNEVISSIKNRADPISGRRLINLILSLENNILGSVSQMYESAKKQIPMEKKFKTLKLALDNITITFMTTNNLGHEELVKALISFTYRDKYLQRTDLAIGFGLDISFADPIREIYFISYKWEYEEKMQKIIEKNKK